MNRLDHNQKKALKHILRYPGSKPSCINEFLSTGIPTISYAENLRKGR